MFCNKCGQQIPDGSVSCPACGAPLKSASHPARAVKGVRLNGFLSLTDLILLAVSFLCFVFGFLPWVGAYGTSVSLVSGSMFTVSAMLGIGKIFLIISILLYPVCLASFVTDLNRVFKRIRLRISLFAPLAYFGLYFLAVFFAFIGAVATTGTYPGWAWYFSFLFCGSGFAILFFLREKMDRWFRK